MGRLGPFEPRPVLAAAVSGGADSLALAVLAADWVVRQGGQPWTRWWWITAYAPRAGGRGGGHGRNGWPPIGVALPATVLTLAGLSRGPALAPGPGSPGWPPCTAACAQGGASCICCSATTPATRRRRCSCAAGGHPAAGRHGRHGCPARDRRCAAAAAAAGDCTGPHCATCCARPRHRPGWRIPSNSRPAQHWRARLRVLLADPAGDRRAVAALLQAGGRVHGRDRAARDFGAAAELAAGSRSPALGYAVLPPGWCRPGGPGCRLAGGVRPCLSAVAPAHGPPCGVAGPRDPRRACACCRPAGWDRAGCWCANEPCRAHPGGGWRQLGRVPAHRAGLARALRTRPARRHCRHPAQGPAARLRDPRLRDPRDCVTPACVTPACVTRVLPAIRRNGTILAVPLLGIGDPALRTDWSPAVPAAGAAFVVAAGVLKRGWLPM